MRNSERGGVGGARAHPHSEGASGEHDDPGQPPVLHMRHCGPARCELSVSAPTLLPSAPTLSLSLPYTLHPTLYTLHPTLYTLHPSPDTLHSSPSGEHDDPGQPPVLHVTHCGPAGCALSLSTPTLSFARTPYTLHPTPYTLHPTPYTLHPTLYTAGRA